MPGPVKSFIVINIVPTLVLALLRVVGTSWRFRETRGHILQQGLASGRPLVGAFFHGRLFQLLYYMSRTDRGKWLAMCSKSVDGEAMSRIEQALGYQVVRGSSGRGGFEALVEMIRTVRKDPGLSPCIAVDGSVGPRGVVQAGVISAAQRTGGLILPVGASARPAFTFKRAWDRTAFPLPFARVHVVYGDLVAVPSRLRPQETEAIRARLEKTMRALQREADELSGFYDPEALVSPEIERASTG